MRITALILLLAAALLCYLLGFIHGALVLVVLGGLLELGFWLGLFKRLRIRRGRKSS